MSDNKTVITVGVQHTPDTTVRKTALASRTVANQKYDDWAADLAPAVYLGKDYVEKIVSIATGGGTSVTTSGYTTVKTILIKNLDPTNFVTFTYRTGGGGGTNQTMVVRPGEVAILTDFTKANNLAGVADTAAVKCALVILKT